MAALTIFNGRGDSYSAQEGIIAKALLPYTALFNTSRVHSFIFMAINVTLVHISDIFIWIGIPKPHPRHSRLI